MPAADRLCRQSAQPRSGEVVPIQGAGTAGDIGAVQQITVLDHEQHDQPIGDAQQCALQIAVGVGGVGQRLAQRGVGRVCDESGSQFLQRAGDTLLQIQQGAGSVVDRGGAPAFQPGVVELGLGLLDLSVLIGIAAVSNGFGGLIIQAWRETAGVNGQEQDCGSRRRADR